LQLSPDDDVMRRPAQKISERWTLDAVLAALDLRPDQEPEEGEAPDFNACISGKMIGLEITMYRSGATVEDGSELRAVRPKATAAGSFPCSSAVGSRSSTSPVAISTMSLANWAGSRGRFGGLGTGT
jgi:hypothetical protein